MNRIFIFLAVQASIAAQTFAPTRLRTEYMADPICIDESVPRFSWALLHPQRGELQTAYQIIVTAAASGTVVWDSGRVASNQTLNVEYGSSGSPLVSDTDYAWSVQYWDSTGSASGVSKATFSTALLTADAWNGATWIAPGVGNILRSEFTLTAGVTRARLYISGMGYYKSYLNGQVTDEHALGPFTTFQMRTTYDSWDVTPLLYPGCNVLSIMLGRGWYTLLGVGPIQVQMMLSVTTTDGATQYFISSPSTAASTRALSDGVSVTSLSFVGTQGPVTSDDIYAGEAYDANLVQSGWQQCNFGNASAWTPAVNASQSPASYGAVMSARTVQITVDEDFGPASIDQPTPDTWVIDFGQNMAGYTTLKVMCDQYSVIVMQYGEILYPNGESFVTAALANSRCPMHAGSVHDNYGPGMQGSYTCAGTGDFETYTTLFSYYGFRYVQLYGFPGVPDEETLTAHFVHTANAQTGDFSSASPLLNQIQHATRYAALSNEMDIPTDCPQRERRGWMGDGQLSFETVVHNFDAAAFYTKWLRDMRDTQVFDNETMNGQGALPDCVPFYGHGGTDSDPGWGIAGFNVLAWATSYFSDVRLVQRYYITARTYLEYWIAKHVTNGLMPFCGYGDWCPVNGANCYPEYGSFFYITALDHTASFALTLNLTGDYTRYSQLSVAARAAYQAAYYNSTSGVFGSGSVLEQVFGLTLGLASPGEDLAVQVMVDGIAAQGNHVIGGIITTKLLYPVLDKYGLTGLGVTMNGWTDYPSYGYWLGMGATTLWEVWSLTNISGAASYNHIMFGGQGSWYYTSIAGIQRNPGSSSWSDITLGPSPGVAAAGIGYAAASIDTAMGAISTAWSAPSGPYLNASCSYVSENSVLNATCYNSAGGIGPGVFDNVTFASFGTPDGSCGTGLSVNPSCNSATSVSVVSAACLGKSQCSVTASNGVFGGDPCPNIVKALAVVLTGSRCASIGFSLDTSIPVNSVATVIVPTGAAGSAATSTITESGTPVWTSGSFTPGVSGVSAGVTVNDGSAVALTVGSGTYSFVVL